MNDIEQGISPMRRVLTVLGTFAAGIVVSVVLWNWWSGRCGDNCPTPSIVHMLVFLGLLPTFSTMTSVLLVSTKWPKNVKLGLAGVLLLVAVVIGALVAQVPAA